MRFCARHDRDYEGKNCPECVLDLDEFDAEDLDLDDEDDFFDTCSDCGTELNEHGDCEVCDYDDEEEDELDFEDRDFDGVWDEDDE